MATKEGGDCYDYTIKEVRNKHKGDVMKRREQWTLSTEAMNSMVQRNNFGSGSMPIFAIDVPDSNDKIHYAKIVVCGDKKLAQQLIDDHNQHTALVEQRDRLAQILLMTICHGCNNRIGWNETPSKYGDWRKCSSCRAARAALATVEQGEGRE